MNERVLIPIPGIGTLALSAEQYREGLAAGAEFSASPASLQGATNEALLDADRAAAELGVTARWLEDMVRAGVVPHHRFGRFVRFNVREVAAHFRVDGARPPTD